MVSEPGRSRVLPSEKSSGIIGKRSVPEAPLLKSLCPAISPCGRPALAKPRSLRQTGNINSSAVRLDASVKGTPQRRRPNNGRTFLLACSRARSRLRFRFRDSSNLWFHIRQVLMQTPGYTTGIAGGFVVKVLPPARNQQKWKCLCCGRLLTPGALKFAKPGVYCWIESL